MTLPIPEGWYELSSDETIKAGDKWCIRNTEVENQWLPSTWIGQPVMSNNQYIRKVTDSEPVSASLSTPQDSQ